MNRHRIGARCQTGSVSNQDPRVCDDVTAAAWIGPRLTGAIGTVTGTVPAGFAAYARICHPARDGDGYSVPWPRVAEATGRRAHPLMQWHAVVGSPDHDNMKGSRWPGDNPIRGNLAPEVLGPLCELLAGHTATAADCFFCLWEGYGWIHGGRSVAISGSVEPVPPAFSADELNRPRVRLPGRDYLLLAGALPTASRIGWRVTPDWFDAQSPNLLWPADRAWCVASGIDFDSTLVGGTVELVEAIRATPALDAWAVRPDEALTFDADRINPVAQPTPSAPPLRRRGPPRRRRR